MHRLVHEVRYGAHSDDNIPSRGYGLGVWTMENAKVMYSMSLSLGGCSVEHLLVGNKPGVS